MKAFIAVFIFMLVAIEFSIQGHHSVKQGLCPSEVQRFECPPADFLKHECGKDSQCAGAKRCCSDGCARQCIAPGAAKCGGVISQESGVITSPGYPAKYPQSVMCLWDIQVRPGSKVALTFEDFDVEFSYKCDYDSLSIMEYGGTKVIKKLCGKDAPASQYVLPSNSVRIAFQTDDYEEQGGFKIKFSAV
eukprot:Seg1882.13 transcript_id=Seg1882.13/GoldUCD/mRNA.D3Y31 product=Cubilin protein_id=Seg1882.13/GoldUCD/D3Y31